MTVCLFYLKYVPWWPCLTACLFWKCSWGRTIIPSEEEVFSFKVCIQFCLPQPSLPATFQSLSPTYISKGGSFLLENGLGVESEPKNQIYMSGGIWCSFKNWKSKAVFTWVKAKLEVEVCRQPCIWRSQKTVMEHLSRGRREEKPVQHMLWIGHSSLDT